MEGESITRGDGSPQSSAPSSQSYNSASHRPHYGESRPRDRDFSAVVEAAVVAVEAAADASTAVDAEATAEVRTRFARVEIRFAARPHEPRSRDEQSNDFAPPKATFPSSLPGESLAKYRDKPRRRLAPVSVAEEPQPVAPNEFADPAAVPQEQRRTRLLLTSHSRLPHRSSHAGLEPLPGETLSKWKRSESPAETAEPRQETPERALHSYENADDRSCSPSRGTRRACAEHEEHDGISRTCTA